MIQREDQFHGFAAFGAVDGGLLAGEDGGDGFLEVGPMPGMADRLRVIGAGAAAFGGRSEHGCVGGQGLFEFEGGQLVVTQDGGAGRAVDTDLGGEARAGPARGRAGERDAASVGEFDPARGDVLNLDALMGDKAGGGGDALGRAEEPEEEVHGVDALVHQCAAAIEGERAAPGRGIIISLRAPPRDERAGEGELAEAAGVERGLERDRPGAEAAGQDAGDGYAGLGAGGVEFVATGERHFEGLLDDDVLACLGAGEGRGEVVAARRAEADDIDVGIGQQRFGRLSEGDAVLGGEVTSLGGRTIVGGDELHAGDLGERFRMELGDHAGSPDPES